MKKYFAFLFIALTGSSVLASTTNLINGYFADAQVGQGFIYENSHLTYGVAGGYKWEINPHVNIVAQAGYTFNGQYSTTIPASYKLNSQSLDFLVGAHYYLTDKLYFIERLGFAVVNQTLTTSADEITLTQIAPEISGGIAYILNPNWALNLSYTRIFGNDNEHNYSTNKVASVDSLFLGLSYNL